MPTKTTVDETITRETLHGPVTGHPIIKENIHRITTKEPVALGVVPPANPPTSEPPLLPMPTPSASETPPTSNTRQERTESSTRVETRTKKSWPWGWIIVILVASMVVFSLIFLTVNNYRKSPEHEPVVPSKKAATEDRDKKILDRIDSLAKANKANTKKSIESAFKGVKSEIEAAKTEITKSIPKPEEIKKIVSIEIEAHTRPVYDRMAVLEKKQEEFEKKLATPPAPPTVKLDSIDPSLAKTVSEATSKAIEPLVGQVAELTKKLQPAEHQRKEGPSHLVPYPPPTYPPGVASPQPITMLPPIPPPPGWKRVLRLGVHDASDLYKPSQLRLKKVAWDDDPTALPTIIARLYLNKRDEKGNAITQDERLPLTEEKLIDINVEWVRFVTTTRPTYIYVR